MTPDQMKWIGALNEAGYKALVCKGFEDAVDAIMNYLEMEKEKNG